MAKPETARTAAATVLAGLLRQQGSLTRLLPAASTRVNPQDRALLAEMCYGVCRYYPRLQGIVAQLVSKPLKAKDNDIQALLLLGCYQLDYMRIPDHAAISETVASTRHLNKAWAKSFVNGVLRQYQRRGKELESHLTAAQSHSHPEWLFARLQQQWPDNWPAIIAANNSPAPMTLRVNILRQPRIAYLQQLQQAGIVAAACRWSEVGIVLEQAVDVGELPGFNEGSCSVQDEASQLVAPLLIGGAAPTRILDCCCAPGGKTGHILELAGPGTHLDAIEIDESRLARVEQNLSRLGLPANLIHADATQPTQWWNGDPYDAILLDAPCSASGVIRRHPDIKLLRQPGDIGKLNQLQSTLLDAVWPCLSSGGSLMYTSCSVLREENDQIVDAFVQRTEDAVSGTIDAPWGNATACGRQHLPDAGANDGFFYARISKC